MELPSVGVTKARHVETGTENPFTKHNRYREYANFSIYNYSRIQTSRINQRTGYIKIAYTFVLRPKDLTRKEAIWIETSIVLS